MSIKRRQVQELAELKPVSNVHIIPLALWKTTPKKHLRFLKTRRIIGVVKEILFYKNLHNLDQILQEKLPRFVYKTAALATELCRQNLSNYIKK